MSGQLCSIGLDYRTADVPALARCRAELERIRFPQRLALFTCNRSEIFCWTEDASAVPVPAGCARLTGSAALAHLFRVASGLESMVFGEYQILGQLKASYAAAKAAGLVGKQLDRIIRDAITCAKRVRTELDLGAVPPSVCRTGLDLVATRTGFAGRRVFVIGSGRTGTLAVKISVEKGAASIAACNRSPERVAHLVRDYGVKVVAYADRYAAIAASDVVISATASPHVVVERNRLALRHPVTFLDLAAPHDVEPSVAELPLATVLSLETIGALAQGDRDERAGLLSAGRALVREAADKTAAWLAAQGAAIGDGAGPEGDA